MKKLSKLGVLALAISSLAACGQQTGDTRFVDLGQLTDDKADQFRRFDVVANPGETVVFELTATGSVQARVVPDRTPAYVELVLDGAGVTAVGEPVTLFTRDGSETVPSTQPMAVAKVDDEASHRWTATLTNIDDGGRVFRGTLILETPFRGSCQNIQGISETDVLEPIAHCTELLDAAIEPGVNRVITGADLCLTAVPDEGYVMIVGERTLELDSGDGRTYGYQETIFDSGESWLQRGPTFLEGVGYERGAIGDDDRARRTEFYYDRTTGVLHIIYETKGWLSLVWDTVDAFSIQCAPLDGASRVFRSWELESEHDE